MKNHKFEAFLESLRNNNNAPLIESIKTGFRVCFEVGDEIDLNKALATIGGEDNEFKARLSGLLQGKFKAIETVLKSLLRPALRGPRKGELIFPSDSANKIHEIEDKFVKYVVRAIYDNYSDIRNGVIWRIHMNELFSGDFIYGLMIQLNERIKVMQEKIEEVKKFYRDKFSKLMDEERKFDNVYRKSIPDNVFNDKESDFWKNVRELKIRVKNEHPRVPDDKLFAYIRNDWNYRKEYDKIKEDFLMSFPEYVEIQNEIKKNFDDERSDIKIMQDQIDEELQKVDYKNIKTVINSMLEFFIRKISYKIIDNTLTV